MNDNVGKGHCNECNNRTLIKYPERDEDHITEGSWGKECDNIQEGIFWFRGGKGLTINTLSWLRIFSILNIFHRT